MGMSIDEFSNKMKLLEDEFGSKKDALYKEYVLSNQKYKIGDVVSDHIGMIKIEKVLFGFTFESEFPECVYFGTELRRDGKVKKKQEGRPVYESNILGKDK